MALKTPYRTHDRPPTDRPVPPSSDAGYLTEDARGNVTWQWSSNNTVLQSDDCIGAAERLRALVDPALNVVDETTARSPLQNARGAKFGYNPYDSGSLVKTERKKKTDLRELSKVILAQRKLAGNSPEKSGK